MIGLFEKMKESKRKHEEAKIDYMARSMLMPFESIEQDLIQISQDFGNDYVNCSESEKNEIVEILSHKYRTPKEQVKIRLSEVECQLSYLR